MLRVMIFLVFFFFFSSRRRHTRSLCDWSSDVCSSDLVIRATLGPLCRRCPYDIRFTSVSTKPALPSRQLRLGDGRIRPSFSRLAACPPLLRCAAFHRQRGSPTYSLLVGTSCLSRLDNEHESHACR